MVLTVDLTFKPPTSQSKHMRDMLDQIILEDLLIMSVSDITAQTIDTSYP